MSESERYYISGHLSGGMYEVSDGVFLVVFWKVF